VKIEALADADSVTQKAAAIIAAEARAPLVYTDRARRSRMVKRVRSRRRGPV